MTKVGFYILADSAADSRLRLALRLTEKAIQRGHRIFIRFKRVAELVNQEPQRLQALRDSYRFYRDRGYPLEQHKLGGV